MGPGDLSAALAPLPSVPHESLLVGRETFDDAGVYRLSDDLALVQTVDFFAPILDDPFTFGQVAAANALSDVYAMGGTPLTAMNIAAFPSGALPLSVLTEILRGGQERVHAAGAVVVGGHTIIDEEVKYGLSVTGRVRPDQLLTNAGARPGDVLVLTKPLGTGILATALKAGKLDQAAIGALVDGMVTLNRAASDVAVRVGIRCATDVTGFGLLGHASHIARASGVTLRIRLAGLPMLPGTERAWREGQVTGGAARNREYLEALVAWGAASEFERAVTVDPQTSGGLLLAVPERALDDYIRKVEGAAVVGDVIAAAGSPIALV